MALMEELMRQRSPNMSGVDSAAVLKALAGNIQAPTSYAYGMNVEDAQREGQLAQQASQQQIENVEALQKQAIAQDAQAQDSAMRAKQIELQEEAQRLNSAMQAHSRYIAERNLALQEKTTAAELAYKNALQGRIASEIESAKISNQKLLMQMEQEEALDKQTVTFPDPLNPEKTYNLPVRVLMSTGGSTLTRYLSGMEGKAKETNADRMFKARATSWINQGISPEGAAYLAATKPENVRNQIEKLVDAGEKAIKPKYGQINYGDKGVDEKGKPIPKTREEWRTEKTNELIDSFYRGLSDEDRAALKGIKIIPPDGDALPAEADPLSTIDINRLAEAIAARYQ